MQVKIKEGKEKIEFRLQNNSTQAMGKKEFLQAENPPPAPITIFSNGGTLSLRRQVKYSYKSLYIKLQTVPQLLFTILLLYHLYYFTPIFPRAFTNSFYKHDLC